MDASIYCSGVQSASARKWRPLRPRFPIWTPRRHPTGVQSALHLQSGRHANHPQASNPPYTSNLDATPTSNRRPNQQPPRIWTPPQPVSGVQSALHPKSGRHADTKQASNPPYTPNLDATLTTHWRPIRSPTHNLDAAPARKWRPPTNPRTRQSLRCHHLNRQSGAGTNAVRISKPLKFEYQTRQSLKCQYLNRQKLVFK